jgi:hypothetical protein
MKAEDDPITDDEYLLRRVHKSRFNPVLSANAFEPRIKGRDLDSDGISLYREACLAHPDEIIALVAPEKRNEQGIVRVPVWLVKSLGLTIKSDVDPSIKGHVVIPELNADAYKADQARFTPVKEKLLAEARKDENIVRRPEVV